MSSDISHMIPLTGETGHLEARFQGELVVSLPIYWYHSKGNCATTLLLTVFI